jgi:hypothetical protein
LETRKIVFQQAHVGFDPSATGPQRGCEIFSDKQYVRLQAHPPTSTHAALFSGSILRIFLRPDR